MKILIPLQGDGMEDRMIKGFWLIGRLIIAFFLFSAIIVSYFYLTDQWLPSYDLEITELGICETRSQYEPTSIASINVENLYICGKTIGTTFRNVRFYVYKDETVIYQERVRLESEIFYIELPKQEQEKKYALGMYRVEARYGRLVAYEATFEIH